MRHQAYYTPNACLMQQPRCLAHARLPFRSSTIFRPMPWLADEVIATQMAIDGADFVEVLRYFLDHADHPEQEFENARRVFRGGIPDGGIPFTKDIVYLDGLLRVHNFLRVVVASGRLDCLQLLFRGKVDLEDMPVLCELSAMGLCRPPRYLPPWVADWRFLLTYLVYSSYLNGSDLGTVRNHYSQLLASSVPAGMRDADESVNHGDDVDDDYRSAVKDTNQVF